MRHYVDSMNRMDKETCGPLVKCMESITGVSHTGISNENKPVDNTFKSLEVEEHVNAID